MATVSVVTLAQGRPAHLHNLVIGLTRQALFAFATVATGWLIVTVTVLLRTSRRRHPWTNDGERRYSGRPPT